MKLNLHIGLFSLVILLITPYLSCSQSVDSFVPKIIPVSKGLYVHRSYAMLESQLYPSNGLIAEAGDSVVLIDTGWDIPQTKLILKWISDSLLKPVKFCIITHSHDDRIAGISVLKDAGIPVYSTALTAKLATQAGFQSPEPVLSDDITLVCGGLQFRIFFPGWGHSPDNIVVWMPYYSALFGGCLIKSTETSHIGNIKDANLSEWLEAIETLKKEFPQSKWIVPGHLGYGGAELLNHTSSIIKEALKKENGR